MSKSHRSVWAAVVCIIVAVLSHTPLLDFIWWCMGRYPRYVAARESASLAASVDDLRRAGL